MARQEQQAVLCLERQDKWILHLHRGGQTAEGVGLPDSAAPTTNT